MTLPNTPARPELPEGTPERIYLVLGNDEGIVPVPFSQLSEVTWCEDQVDAADPEFIRADVVQRLLADERRKALESVAAEWDGCIYQAPGQDIDIGAAIRALIDPKEPTK